MAKRKIIDSRRFSTTRLESLAGYDEEPVVDDSLVFDLPRMNQYRGWIIERLHSSVPVRHLLWSPNSSQTPYYPGIPPKNLALRIADEPRLRRVDGHLGRYDFTVSPQCLTTRPWMALILTPESGYPRRREFPEFEMIFDAWDNETGRLRGTYLDALSNRLVQLETDIEACSELLNSFTNHWESRPKRFDPARIQFLSNNPSYDDAVDIGVDIQRGLKEKAAYLAFARRLLDEGWQGAIDKMKETGILAADEQFLGAWINGNRPHDAQWLLSQRIPCFLIHTLGNLDGYLSHEAVDVRDSWIERTSAAKLRLGLSGYEHVASKNNGPERSRYTRGPTRPRLNIPWEHEWQSSPSHQGWHGTYTGYFAVRPPSPPRPPSPIPEINSDRPKADPALDAPALNLVEAYPGHALWVRPPEVFDVRNKPGKWTHWDEDDKDVYVRVKSSEEASGCYQSYDRENRRVLYSSSKLTEWDGVFDRAVFGWPAPRASFWETWMSGKTREWRQRKSSYWVYGRREPTDEDVKRRVQTPPPEALPIVGSNSAAVSALLDEAMTGLSTPPPKESVTTASQPVSPPDVVMMSPQRRPTTPDSVLSWGNNSEFPGAVRTQVPLPPPAEPLPNVAMEQIDDDREAYIRSGPFSLDIPWLKVRDSLFALAEQHPEIHIVRCVQTATLARQTVWVATSSQRGANLLKDLYQDLSDKLVGSLLTATAAEFNQASQAFTSPPPPISKTSRSPSSKSRSRSSSHSRRRSDSPTSTRRRSHSRSSSSNRSRHRSRIPSYSRSRSRSRRLPSPPLPFSRSNSHFHLSSRSPLSHRRRIPSRSRSPPFLRSRSRNRQSYRYRSRSFERRGDIRPDPRGSRRIYLPVRRMAPDRDTMSGAPYHWPRLRSPSPSNWRSRQSLATSRTSSPIPRGPGHYSDWRRTRQDRPSRSTSPPIPREALPLLGGSSSRIEATGSWTTRSSPNAPDPQSAPSVAPNAPIVNPVLMSFDAVQVEQFTQVMLPIFRKYVAENPGLLAVTDTQPTPGTASSVTPTPSVATAPNPIPFEQRLSDAPDPHRPLEARLTHPLPLLVTQGTQTTADPTPSPQVASSSSSSPTPGTRGGAAGTTGRGKRRRPGKRQRMRWMQEQGIWVDKTPLVEDPSGDEPSGGDI